MLYRGARPATCQKVDKSLRIWFDPFMYVEAPEGRRLQTSPLPARPAPVGQSAPANEPTAFTPCIRLFTDRVLVEAASGKYEERELAVLSLSFDYGGTRLRVSDLGEHFYVGGGSGVEPVARDLGAEAKAQCLLESFGAVDLACLDGHEPSFGSDADYLVQAEQNVHALCSFSAHAIPELKKLGWRVDVPADYPYQVVGVHGDWYARVDETEDGDWFSLELGVEVEGRRVDVLPALVALLDEHPGASSLQGLFRLTARYRAIYAGPNRYVPVPVERLERILKVLREMYGGKRVTDSTLRLSRFEGQALAELDRAFATKDLGLAWTGGQRLRERAEALAAPPEPCPPPPGLRASLRSYQREGVAWLQRLRALDLGGVLADDMGLGKTLQTLCHLLIEKHSGRMDRPSLVVMPTSLVGNWRRELCRFTPSLRVVVIHGPERRARWGKVDGADVVLTTYPVLLRDLGRFCRQRFHLVILDEAQTIKNPRSRAKAACASLEARHRVCLTGTPVENNLDELWSLVDFLVPGLLGTAQEFRRRFRQPIETEGRADVLVDLRERLAPYLLRRMKEQVATELPPKTDLVRPIELRGEQRDLYESIRVAAHGQVRQAIRRHGLSASTVTILDALMKLRQVCCDPRLVPVESARSVRRSAKLEVLLELLDGQLGEGRRVLVFSQFAQMLALISLALRARGIAHVELTGATTDRQRSVDAFQAGDASVFLISLKAGGTGLNLTRADTVIHYDPWWNAAAKSQATDRAHRIGQKNPVFVYNLIIAGSVEERMLKLQHRKKQLAETLLGPAVEHGTKWSAEELDDLFAPLAESCNSQ